MLERIGEWLLLYGLRVVGALAILIIGWLVAKLLRDLIKRLLGRTNLADAATSFLASLAFAGMMTFVIIAAIGHLGIQTASLVAVMAAAGLAIGLALQGSLANFAAGFLLVVFHPFKIGDYIEGAGASGTVERIEIFTTTLRTPDNKQVIIPNARMTGDNIVNYSANETRRIDMVVGISYGDDIDKAQQVLMDVLRSDSRVLEEPAPAVVVSELADSSVNFNVRPWVKVADYWDVRFELTKQAKLKLDANKISIPFPQQDVHVYREAADK